MHEVIFEADTPLGKVFDIVLLIAIITSVIAVTLDTVQDFRDRYHGWLLAAEWFFTILFSIEYILRLICVRRPSAYAKSFFGVVDLLAILPTYLGLFLPGAHELLVIRALRLIRVFRVFKLARFLKEGEVLRRALLASRAKIVVFVTTILTVVTVMGALMHLVEGPENGFTSIPISMYWAIVTMSTVGYGDISPQTPLGQCFAAVLIMLGYSLIIVPTGIVSAELTSQRGEVSRFTTQHCPHCGREGHDADAKHCKFCGGLL